MPADIKQLTPVGGTAAWNVHDAKPIVYLSAPD